MRFNVNDFLNLQVDFGGETMSLGRVIQELERIAGGNKGLIDAYLMGFFRQLKKAKRG